MSNADNSDGEQVVYAADSNSEYAERMQYTQMFDARRRALEKMAEVGGFENQNVRKEHQQALLIARSAVESYILSFQELVKSKQNAPDKWENEIITTIDISEILPVQRRVKQIKDVRTNLPTKNGKIAVVGLRTWLNLSNKYLEVDYEIELPRRGNPTETKTERVKIQTPKQSIMAAFEAADDIRSELDIGISFGSDEEAEWDTDYRDEPDR